ncbi:MAG: hypothetical protein ACLFNK_00900 [Candidatus Woesearchaeota archaeon]
MIRIIVLNSLRNEILKNLKQEATKVYSLIDQLKENPNKGKTLGNVGGILIKELRFKSFRFYFVVDGNELALFNKGKLEDLLIKFIEMSKKNNQQSTIERIRKILEEIR